MPTAIHWDAAFRAASASQSFVASTTPFSITYGSGAAYGVLGSDIVQFAGFEVENQVFGMSFVTLVKAG